MGTWSLEEKDLAKIRGTKNLPPEKQTLFLQQLEEKLQKDHLDNLKLKTCFGNRSLELIGSIKETQTQNSSIFQHKFDEKEIEHYLSKT